jgi:hypothetical protein
VNITENQHLFGVLVLFCINGVLTQDIGGFKKLFANDHNNRGRKNKNLLIEYLPIKNRGIPLPSTEIHKGL